MLNRTTFQQENKNEAKCISPLAQITLNWPRETMRERQNTRGQGDSEKYTI